MTEGLLAALGNMQSWMFLLVFLIGALNGMFSGLLPGLSGSVGIALMIPFTYGLGPTEAMGLFVAALAGQNFSGSVSAILLNVPGSSPSAATTFDGYPLARQGRGGFAIGVSAAASFLGTLIGIALIISLFPVVRTVILAFSFPELMMLAVLGLVIIVVASRGSMIKGLLSGTLGLMVSFVGFAPIGGDVRYVFDRLELYDGINIVAVLVGLFAITEALRLLVENQQVAQNLDQLRFGKRQMWEGAGYVVRQPFLLVRSSLLGTAVGVVPAVGGTLASFLAYFQAAKSVKDSKFGQGDPRGVLAPEAANDAKDAGSALPSLAFGIPGSADWAIVLGAMIIHGVTPGPNLIRDHPDIVWVAILVIVGSSFFTSMLGMLFGPSLIQVTRLRPGVLAPVVLMLGVVGSFAVGARTTDVLLAIGFGLLGFAMRAIGMPVIPLILGLVLGPLVERSFLQTLSTFGTPTVIATRPISGTLLVLAIAVVVFEITAAHRARKRSGGVREEGVRSAVRPIAIAVMAGLALLALGAIVLGTQFSEEGRLFPFITATVMLSLAVVYLLIACVPPLRRRLGGIIADGGGMEQMVTAQSSRDTHVDDAPDSDRPVHEGPLAGGAATVAEGQPQGATTATATETASAPAPAERPPTRPTIMRDSLLLLVALGVGSLLFGLAVTAPPVLFLYLRVLARESWRSTLVVGIGTLAFFYVTFVYLLGVPMTGGLLLDY